MIRVPSGTRTRAPATGVASASGTRYVSAGSEGTGTATLMNRKSVYAGFDGCRGGWRSRSARAFLRSSQAYFFWFGLRSRNDG